jgi:plasmid stability protein
MIVGRGGSYTSDSPNLRVDLRLPRELVQRLKSIAGRHGRSLNSEIAYVLGQYAEQQDNSGQS